MIRFKQILSLALSFVALSVYAQTQRGLVRTAGTSTHRGVPVSGAVVKVKGNYQQVLSGSKGEFSVPMPGVRNGESYQLLNVTKKGYEFADKDFLSRRFAYSDKSILEIVLLSSAELQKEKQEIEEKVLKVIKENYTKKLNALKQDKEKGKISIEEYRKKYKAIQEQYDTFDEVISDLAEHYARTDYDLIDSLDAQINTCIINGELDNADLLLAQKGNLDDRIAAYQRHAATNAAAREKLAKLSEELQEQRIAYEKERDDISNDLYNKHSIAISRFDFDKALEMLKLRADLDTTNVKAVYEYAELCYKQKKFNDSETYYLICLAAYIKAKDISHIAATQNNLGILYYGLHEYTNSENYLKLALEDYEQLFAQNPDVYRADLAYTQNNLGNLYYALHDYTNSEKYYKLALESKEHLFAQNPDAYRADLSDTQNNIGTLYHDLHDYTSSEKYLKLALENYEQLFTLNPDTYREKLTGTQNNLGILYLATHDFSNSEKYLILALENRHLLFAQNPDAYRADLAATQDNLGSVYSHIHDYTNGEKYLQLALEHREMLFAQNPDAYQADLAATQHNLGNLYDGLHDYTNSEKYHKWALKNREMLFAQNPNAYRADLALSLYSLGLLYGNLRDYINSEKYLKLALEHREMLFAQNPNTYRADLASTQNIIGILYGTTHNHVEGEKYLKLALENNEFLYAQNPNMYQRKLFLIFKALLFLYQEIDNNEQYDECLSKALALCSDLYKIEPSIYKEDLIDLKNRKVLQMLQNSQYMDALQLAKETYELDESNFDSRKHLALCCNYFAYILANNKQYTDAHEIIDIAVELMPDVVMSYDIKGEIFLMQGKTEEALRMWRMVLEKNPDFLKENPNGSSLSNSLKKLGLIE